MGPAGHGGARGAPMRAAIAPAAATEPWAAAAACARSPVTSV
jgi:hypothetical protein